MFTQESESFVFQRHLQRTKRRIFPSSLGVWIFLIGHQHSPRSRVAYRYPHDRTRCADPGGFSDRAGGHAAHKRDEATQIQNARAQAHMRTRLSVARLSP